MVAQGLALRQLATARRCLLLAGSTVTAARGGGFAVSVLPRVVCERGCSGPGGLDGQHRPPSRLLSALPICNHGQHPRANQPCVRLPTIRRGHCDNIPPTDPGSLEAVPCSSSSNSEAGASHPTAFHTRILSIGVAGDISRWVVHEHHALAGSMTAWRTFLLDKLGMDIDTVSQILIECPDLLQQHPGKDATRFVGFLEQELGLDIPQASRLVVRHPAALLPDGTDALGYALRFLEDEAGVLRHRAMLMLRARPSISAPGGISRLRATVAWLVGGLDMPRRDVGRLLVTNPLLLEADLSHSGPSMANYLEEQVILTAICQYRGCLYGECGV